MLQNTNKEVHKYELNLPGNAGAQFIATHIVLFVLATLPFWRLSHDTTARTAML